MSEPAAFAVIRNGETQYFSDRWASAVLRREVIWGPNDFEEWISQFESLDEWAEDCDGGAVVDFDKQTLLWSGDISAYDIPRVFDVYRKLLSAAWPGFDVRISERTDELAERLGIHFDEDEDDVSDEGEDEEWLDRSETVQEALRYHPEDDDEDEETTRAWVTIVDPDGTLRQRVLDELPLDLLKANPEAMAKLAKIQPAEIPKEAVVSEGLWLNPSDKTAAVWGSSTLLKTMKQHGKCWKGWKLKWLKRGYSDHCALCGTQGIPMNTAEALSKVLPMVLSTEQFNMQTVIGAIGGGIKKFAVKATGCLLLVICLPLVIFGVISGNWTPVFISIAATILVVAVLFKLIANRFKKAVLGNLPKKGDQEPTTLVAGPQEEEKRRERIDKLLAAAKLPRLAEVEPLFPDASGLELLAS